MAIKIVWDRYEDKQSSEWGKGKDGRGNRGKSGPIHIWIFDICRTMGKLSIIFGKLVISKEIVDFLNLNIYSNEFQVEHN